MCLATVWVVCVLGVAVAVFKELDGGQYGIWASAAVYVLVCLVVLVAAVLWVIVFEVMHVPVLL